MLFKSCRIKVDNLILHSDQGWQYQMKSYQNLLKAKGITQSMSRKATCLDNAVAENFFGLLKTELFYLEKFDSIDQLEKAIIDYIDYYNNRRIKLKLNGLSPVQYRIQTVGVGVGGTVFPCAGWQNNVIGDLNHQTVQEIWETSAKIKELRQVKRSRFLQCVDCKDRGYCTVCMMWNSNENPDGAPFRINQYRCNVAAMTHRKVDKALQRISSAKITSR